MDLSVVVIISPLNSMPSTSLINYDIKSAGLIDGIQISAFLFVEREEEGKPPAIDPVSRGKE